MPINENNHKQYLTQLSHMKKAQSQNGYKFNSTPRSLLPFIRHYGVYPSTPFRSLL